MEAKKFYTLEEIEDKYIGEKGTPKRDAMSRTNPPGADLNVAKQRPGGWRAGRPP